jgi:hypothetical protein
MNRVVAQAIKLLSDNAPTILTSLGVTGTVATAALSARGAFRAGEIIRAENENRELTPKEKVKLTWKEFIPAAGVGALTVTCIIGLNRVGMRRAAALAAAYSLSEKAFEEYKSKVVERIGEQKEQRLRDDLAQDQVTRNPLSANEVIMTGNGDVLCYDAITGRYFMSQVESIRRAENDINHQILTQNFASLYNFYELIGLPGTPFSHEMGWDVDKLMEVKFSAVISEDGRPCISINYKVDPLRRFHTLM